MKPYSTGFCLLLLVGGLGLSAACPVVSLTASQEVTDACSAPRNPVESRAIRASGGKVAREGCTLSLRVGENRRTLVDDLREQGSTYIRYEYQGPLAGTQFQLVAVFFYEGTAYEIIGPRGNSRIVGVPVMSPDGRRAMASSKDLYAGFNPNGLEIWNLERGFPRLELSLRSDEWGPSDATWTDAQTIEFGQTALDDNGVEQTRRGARLQLSESGWTFVPAGKQR